MLDWLYLAMERRARADSQGQAKGFQEVSPSILRKLRKAKLIRTLRHVYRNSPAQRKSWNDAGLNISDLRSPEVLGHLPFTTGRQVAEHGEDYLCVPPEELIHILTTSATKGMEKTIYLTDDDFNHQVRMIGATFLRLPGASRVAAMFLVHDPTWSVGTIMRRAIAEAGMLGFLSGVHRSIPEQIALIKKYRINCIMTSPSYLSRLTFESPQDVKDLGVLFIQLGAQPWTEKFRDHMQEAWGATLLDCYGSNECACGIASECLCQNGLHMGEADYWIEIVDPATGELLPEGEEGEIIITTLSRRGMPLIRYRTGDLSSLLPNEQRCECGSALGKIGRIRGRVDDMLIVGAGHNLYPDEIDRAVFSIPGVTDYQLVIGKDGHKEVVHLTVEAAKPQDDMGKVLLKLLLGIDSIGLSHDVAQTLTLGKMQVVAPGSLSQGRPKTIRIIDKRNAVAVF